MIILYGVAIAGAIFCLWWALTAKAPAARANLMAGLDLPEAPPRTSLFSALGQRLRRFFPQGYLGKLTTNLVKAGYPRGMDLPRLLTMKVLVSVTLGAVWLVIGQPIVALVFFLAGFFGPDYWLMSERDKRQNLMRDAAADTIDQLTIVVEAGLGFDAALLRVASTNVGPLSDELQHTVADMRAGMPRDLALKALADRTQIPEVRQLVVALTQAQKHGTPLANSLRIQAHELRDKRTQRVEEKAAKMGTKMIFPVVFCFMPVFFIVILVPAIHGIVSGFSH